MSLTFFDQTNIHNHLQKLAFHFANGNYTKIEKNIEKLWKKSVFLDIEFIYFWLQNCNAWFENSNIFCTLFDINYIVSWKENCTIKQIAWIFFFIMIDFIIICLKAVFNVQIKSHNVIMSDEMLPIDHYYLLAVRKERRREFSLWIKPVIDLLKWRKN